MSGMSLEIRSGDVLLALSAWNLYPDMVVLGLEQTIIRQKDDLFPTGALLTIGLHSEESRPDVGIFWSLPLAYLRCYGEPVLTTRSLSTNEQGRLSMNELLQAVVCFYLKGLDLSGTQTVPALKLFVNISERLLQALGRDWSMSWLSILSKAAQRQLAWSIDARYAKSLRNLGIRQGEKFLGGVREPLFGLLDYGTFVNTARSAEDVIEVLRELAQTTGLSGNDMFIRYRPRQSLKLDGTLDFVYATAVPGVLQGTKRTVDAAEEPNTTHFRWLSNTLGSMSIDHITHDAQPERVGGLRELLGTSPYMGNKMSRTLSSPSNETFLILERHPPRPITSGILTFRTIGNNEVTKKS